MLKAETRAAISSNQPPQNLFEPITIALRIRFFKAPSATDMRPIAIIIREAVALVKKEKLETHEIDRANDLVQSLHTLDGGSFSELAQLGWKKKYIGC